MKLRPTVFAIALAAVAVTAFGSGYALRPKLNAESLSKAYAKYVQGQPSHKESLKDGVLASVLNSDFARLIQITTPEDVAARRAAMAEFIFRGEPDGMGRRPDTVEHDQIVPPLADLKLAGIDVLTVRMRFGIESHIYHLRAQTPRSCLMVYQEGHQVSFLERKRFIKRMTDEGCDVLALSLPLTGALNNRPWVDHPRFGKLLLNDPDDLQLLESVDHSSQSFFFLPLAAALNHALDQHSYERIGATGFSGGGWAVQIFAALDPRIQTTYSVAGSSPTPVHAAKPEWGSPEQRQGRLYEIANYPEIYVMAADRHGRRHLQFFNETDPCCFAGHTWIAWNGPVGDRVRQLGGQFRILSYVNDRHTLSKPVALTIVDDFLKGGTSVAEGVTAH